LYGLRQADATLKANGLDQPLIVSETVYDNPDYAAAIQEFRQTSTRPILEVQEWPLQAGNSCSALSGTPPYRADPSLKGMPGAPPDTTLTAELHAKGRVSLIAPYGEPAVALEAGTYTLEVADRSKKLGFRLAGPGIRIKTGRRSTGSTTRTIALRSGVYRFGTTAKHRSRLTVFR